MRYPSVIFILLLATVNSLVPRSSSSSSLSNPIDNDACTEVANSICASSASTDGTVLFYPVPSSSSSSSYGIVLCTDNSHGSKANGTTNNRVAIGCSATPLTVVLLLQGTENSTTIPPLLVSSSYSAYYTVNSTTSIGYGSIPLNDAQQTLLNITDTYTNPSDTMVNAYTSRAAALAMVQIYRTVQILYPSPSMKGNFTTRTTTTTTSTGTAATIYTGFASRYALTMLLPSSTNATTNATSIPLEQLDWFSPGLLYGNGSYLPPWAIGGTTSSTDNRSTVDAVVFREDRIAAPVASLFDPVSLSSLTILRPVSSVPNTVLNDTLLSVAYTDNRMDFSSLGYERGNGNPNHTQIVIVYPGSEYPRTYVSGTPQGSLWRFHALQSSTMHNFSFIIMANTLLSSSVPVSSSSSSSSLPFPSFISWLWTGCLEYYQPLVRTDINISTAYEALVRSLTDTYLPAAPVSGVPTGFDKLTGIAYSPVLELGFVGPQLRMAVSIIQSGLATLNSSRLSIGITMMDNWINSTNTSTYSAYSHAVWNMDETMMMMMNMEENERIQWGRNNVSCYLGDTECVTLTRNPVRTNQGIMFTADQSGTDRSSHSTDSSSTAAVPSPSSSFPTTLGWWIDDGNTTLNDQEYYVVYLRRAVVAHQHALDIVTLLQRYCSNHRTIVHGANPWPPIDVCNRIPVYTAWGLGLGSVLLQVQNSNGSFVRQYTVPLTPASLPLPSQSSTTGTILPVRYLVTCYEFTGYTSYLTAALAAGEYAWDTYGQYGWYVGAAIDNPDVLDKESSLFALDAFFALYTVTGNTTWLDRAISASTVASTWIRITNIPNPSDNPSMDWTITDTSVGMGLIATGHSGSDTFDSMFLWSRLQLCILTVNNGTHNNSMNGSNETVNVHGTGVRLGLYNSKQPLDLNGTKHYAHPGFMSELFAFSIGWNIFTGRNDGRGIGDPHFVPWTSANGAYGIAQFCLSVTNENTIVTAPEACLPMDARQMILAVCSGGPSRNGRDRWNR